MTLKPLSESSPIPKLQNQNYSVLLDISRMSLLTSQAQTVCKLGKCVLQEAGAGAGVPVCLWRGSSPKTELTSP